MGSAVEGDNQEVVSVLEAHTSQREPFYNSLASERTEI